MLIVSHLHRMRRLLCVCRAASPIGIWLLAALCDLLIGCHQRMDDFRAIAMGDTPAMVTKKVGPRDDTCSPTPTCSTDIWRNGDGTQFEVVYESGKVMSAILRTNGMYSVPNISILTARFPEPAGDGLVAPR